MVTNFIKNNKCLIINFCAIVLILVLFLIKSILQIVLNKILVILAIILGLVLLITNLIIIFKFKDDNKVKKIFGTINEYYQIVLLVLLAVEIVFGFIFFPATVSQTSMTPTLQPDDTLLVTSTKKITNNDIIVFRYDNTIQKANVNVENNELLIKRVIGIPGQKIEYKSDGLYIDDVKQEDQFFIPSMNGLDVYALAKFNGIEDLCLQSDGSYIIPDGWYIVFGDHREVSIDSRAFGLVREDQIYGHVWLKKISFFNWQKLK